MGFPRTERKALWFRSRGLSTFIDREVYLIGVGFARKVWFIFLLLKGLPVYHKDHSPHGAQVFAEDTQAVL